MAGKVKQGVGEATDDPGAQGARARGRKPRAICRKAVGNARQSAIKRGDRPLIDRHHKRQLLKSNEQGAPSGASLFC